MSLILGLLVFTIVFFFVPNFVSYMRLEKRVKLIKSIAALVPICPFVSGIFPTYVPDEYGISEDDENICTKIAVKLRDDLVRRGALGEDIFEKASDDAEVHLISWVLYCYVNDSGYKFYLSQDELRVFSRMAMVSICYFKANIDVAKKFNFDEYYLNMYQTDVAPHC